MTREDKYVERLIHAARHRLAFGETPRQAREGLVASGATREEAYLATVAAKLLERDDEPGYPQAVLRNRRRIKRRP